MEPELSNITLGTTSGTQNLPEVERPLSPIERIVAGDLDGRSLLASVDGSKMDGLLIALAKTLKLLTKEKLSTQEKRKAYAALEKISTEDIRKACEEASMKTINALTAFDDVTVEKVAAPEIADNPSDHISPMASKDFSTRINNGYFSSLQKHSVKIKDILTAVADVVIYYKLSPKAALSLLRRCLRDPARQLMENLVRSGSSLESLFQNLQDHYNFAMSPTEASLKLRNLLNSPMENLDDFLSELLNLSIASVRDLPSTQQSSSGFLMATGFLQQYLQKYCPQMYPIFKHEFRQIQSAQKGMLDPAASYLSMMRVLRLHREAIESSGKRGNSKHATLNAIEVDPRENEITPMVQQIETKEPPPPPGPSLDEIRDLIKTEFKQNATIPAPSTKPESSDTLGQVKNMVQEIFQGVIGIGLPQTQQVGYASMSPDMTVAQTIPGYIQEIGGQPQGQNWQRPPQSQGNPQLGAQPPRPLGAAQQQHGGYMPKWMPQIAQRANQMFQGRPPFGQGQNQPMRQNQGLNGNPNRIPLQNPGNQFGFRRNLVPEDVYSAHFSKGNCFLCALTGHSFRQCPIFGPGHPVSSTACPDCEHKGIKAFHHNCQGKNYKAHQNMMRGQAKEQGNSSTQGNQVNQLDGFSQFYPEEGFPFMQPEPFMVQENFPMYIPEGCTMSKNA